MSSAGSGEASANSTAAATAASAASRACPTSRSPSTPSFTQRRAKLSIGSFSRHSSTSSRSRYTSGSAAEWPR